MKSAKPRNSKQGPEGKVVEVHLKLPDITSEPNAIINVNGKTFCGSDTPLEFEYDVGSSFDGDDEDLFHHQHILRNKIRMSSELRDLYEVLQKLPYPQYSESKRKATDSSERTRRWVDSTTKQTFTSSQKRYIPSTFHRKDSHLPIQVPEASSDASSGPDFIPLADHSDFPSEDDISQSSSKPNREHLKLRAINLYDSILPPSLFSSHRHKIRKGFI